MKVKSRLTESELQALLRPRLLLFLSVDIEGSTRLKQQAGTDSYQRWLPPLFAFLKEFEEDFAAVRAEVARELDRTEPESPTAWKILGDELVYVAELHHRSEGAFHLRAFSRTIAKRNREGLKKMPLQLKGSAWLAGFPVRNALIPLETGAFDYLGASIDVGFRLARLASPRLMSISVDLAWLLLSFQRDFKIYYEGRKQLKGVMEDEGYPVLLFDTGATSLQECEDKLAGRQPSDPEQLRKFCEAFILQHGQPRHLPFIAGDTGFSNPPPDYQAQLDGVTGLLRHDLFLVTEEFGQGQPAVSAIGIQSEISAQVESLTTQLPPSTA